MQSGQSWTLWRGIICFCFLISGARRRIRVPPQPLSRLPTVFGEGGKKRSKNPNRVHYARRVSSDGTRTARAVAGQRGGGSVGRGRVLRAVGTTRCWGGGGPSECPSSHPLDGGASLPDRFRYAGEGHPPAPPWPPPPRARHLLTTLSDTQGRRRCCCRLCHSRAAVPCGWWWSVWTLVILTLTLSRTHSYTNAARTHTHTRARTPLTHSLCLRLTYIHNRSSRSICAVFTVVECRLTRWTVCREHDTTDRAISKSQNQQWTNF